MRYWDFNDWMIFALFVVILLIAVGIFLPLFMGMSKAAWAWLLSV